MNREVTFTAGPSAGQGDSEPILNPRLMRRGDSWVVAFDQSDNVTRIGEVIAVPDPPSLEAQIAALNNLNKQALTDLETITRLLAEARAVLIAGADIDRVVVTVDDAINAVLDATESLS
jgi:hypothetical protein